MPPPPSSSPSSSSPSSSSPVRAILTDIGGVVVRSPMLAITAYETRNNLPPGYINHAISASSPNGAWSKIERGQIPLDEAFFREFKSDLENPDVWAGYCARVNWGGGGGGGGGDDGGGDGGGGKHTRQAQEEGAKGVLPPPPPPPVPDIDAEGLFWDMMRVSREFDPVILPAYERARAISLQRHSRATTGGGGGGGGGRGEGTTQPPLLLAALTNDYTFPPTHPYTHDSTAHKLRSVFDVWVSSSASGLRKPEKEIYELALRRINEECEKRGWGGAGGGGVIRPEEVVFLDDIGMNLKGARAVGMRTVKVSIGGGREVVRVLEGLLGLDEGELGGQEREREGENGGSGSGSKL